MKLGKVLMGMAVMLTLAFVSCKPKDEDILKSVNEKIAGMTEMKGMTATVKDGVVTLSGECKDEKCKADCQKAIEDAKIKGVNSVVSNCTIAPPPAPAPASVTAAVTDPKLQDAVKAIIKDIPGVTIEGFSDKGVILKGEISKANNLKLKQALAAAKIMLDAASKLTVK
jgi:hyperosmotically inducible periplasmic protein